jgi:tight adherence protein B
VRALSELGTTLEARKDLQREIRTMLSGAVFTSYLVMVMGVGTIVLINVISPGVLREMTTTIPGIAALAVSAALYGVAYALIRQITRVDT